MTYVGGATWDWHPLGACSVRTMQPCASLHTVLVKSAFRFTVYTDFICLSCSITLKLAHPVDFLRWEMLADLTCQKLIATLAFRRFENSPPPYHSELFHTYQPSQTLRSSYEKPFEVPKTNLKSAGNRSFHFQASYNRPQLSISPYFQQKIWKHIFLKNASLLVFRKALFLPTLTMAVWI